MSIVGIPVSYIGFNLYQSWSIKQVPVYLQPFVRREACMGLYRLCLGKTIDSSTGYNLLLPMLSSLLSFLNDALNIKPNKNIEVSVKVKICYLTECFHYQSNQIILDFEVKYFSMIGYTFIKYLSWYALVSTRQSYQILQILYWNYLNNIIKMEWNQN